MNTLRSRKDLFAAHEEVVRVGEGGIRRVGHGVKGTDGDGEFVKDEVIGLVFFTNESTEELFVFSAKSKNKGRMRGHISLTIQ